MEKSNGNYRSKVNLIQKIFKESKIQQYAVC